MVSLVLLVHAKLTLLSTDDYQSLPAEAEKAVNARRVEDLKEFLGQLDVLTVNCPLHETTRGIINKETLSYLKKGAWIVNTVRFRGLPFAECPR